MHRYFIVIIGLFLVLSSCRAHRQVVQHTSSDSTVVSFHEVEKLVQIPGDTVSVNMVAALASANNESGKHPEFIPQSQTIQTKRTKVNIELTKSGQIKATAISKKLDEKVSVQEKTIQTSKSSVTILEQKDSWFKRTLKSVESVYKTILITLFILLGLYAWLRYRGQLKSLVNKITKKV